MTEPAPRRRPRAGNAPILAAAMLAVGEIFEPEKTEVELEMADLGEGLTDLPISIDFGDLPDLN
ncbi:MAG: hypothetical protein GY929_04530 [Actinomycetia bacterium]|nr:hypothetical protein [Actinomycetes bacterium]